jgi:hypothetical protein
MTAVDEDASSNDRIDIGDAPPQLERLNGCQPPQIGAYSLSSDLDDDINAQCPCSCDLRPAPLISLLPVIWASSKF